MDLVLVKASGIQVLRNRAPQIQGWTFATVWVTVVQQWWSKTKHRNFRPSGNEHLKFRSSEIEHLNCWFQNNEAPEFQVFRKEDLKLWYSLKVVFYVGNKQNTSTWESGPRYNDDRKISFRRTRNRNSMSSRTACAQTIVYRMLRASIPGSLSMAVLPHFSGLKNELADFFNMLTLL